MNNDRMSRTKRLIPASILMIALFAALACFVLPGTLAELEAAVYHWAEGLMSPGFTAFMRAVTRLIDPPFVIAFCVLLLVIPATRRTVALPVDAAAAAAFAVNLLLKRAFARERPDILRMVEETSPSFPSAHAMVSAAMYTMLILLLFSHTERAAPRAAATVPLVLLTVAIGFSRVYLGVHHAGDIVGGWLLGIPIAAVLHHIWRANPQIRKFLQKPTPKH